MPALRKAVAASDIVALDTELARLAPKTGLTRLAAAGLRGESAFCVPLLLRQNSYLLGYYRLLLGFSQKAFYTSATGLARFKALEAGRLPENLLRELELLCTALNQAAATLICGLPVPLLNEQSLGDLTLLTLGAQLRGGANVQKGTAGIKRVFTVIQRLTAHATEHTGPSSITLKNSSRRRVRIEFAADPDLIIREELSGNNHELRNIIAIEIKAGTDFSNIHNRIGEAEKSHQKAKQIGYTECWTIVNVDNINLVTARTESPSTNRFYRLSQIEQPGSAECKDFASRILGLTGIAAPNKKRAPSRRVKAR